ncbi:YrrS family protein [Fictibacillus phosphorivorans]|uniref:YrrS family protein n=1 Tax=Fictibacillus phosphorivorans TaxID=1221500 RepID=UPI00203AE734|nr:YrrS family protein [Fictibacillus phosphorivorans]MCM3718980.1 YrrS family protein [Fictibacillus phosphorivorans]MCM3776602.1 YrrS family protein [Fictibacillus phosphorivorans]
MGRYNKRENSTKKRNVVLFSTLSAILLALLFLPKDALLIGNEEEKPVEKESKEPKHKVVKLQPDNESAYDDDETNKDQKEEATTATEEPSEEIGIDPEKEADQKKKAEEKKKKVEEKKKKQAAANKPKLNEPIGTSQTGTHTSSYEKGSVDWNEKLKAIRLATGLDENMTVWKIANGGGPQKSVAEVSPDGKPGERYTVNLEWVDQKGWKVTSVKK